MKVQLVLLKREYMVKIGSLIAKDYQLDFEIIRYHNIITLLEAGASYEEALK